VTLVMVTPAVIIPEMVISRMLMILVVMVESGVIDALTAGRTPTRRNATVTLPSFGRRQWPDRSIFAHGVPGQGTRRGQALGNQLRQEAETHLQRERPERGAQQLIDLVANVHINLNGFDGPVPITVDEYNAFEEDVMRISNAIHDNAIVVTVTSRGSVTTLKLGTNPCGPFRGQHLDGEALEALYQLHTPDVNAGRRPVAGIQLRRNRTSACGCNAMLLPHMWRLTIQLRLARRSWSRASSPSTIWW
jgi:hypothetical protein